MKFSGQKGFTLVELLVVISIVSMLASVVVASVGSAREKGRIAAIVKFATNLYHTNGDRLILHYDFDEGASSLAVKDVSQSGNDGTYRSSPFSPPGEESSYIVNKNKAAIFSGSTAVKTNNVLKIPRAATITVWFKTQSTSEYLLMFNNREFSQDWRINPLQREFSFGLLQSKIFVGEYGKTKSGDSWSGNLRDGKWHHLVWTSSGDLDQFYIDGRPMGKQVRPPECECSRSDIETIFNVGYAAFSPFSGTVDDFMVYGQEIAAQDVRALYAQGLKTHPSL